jgi:hypothetical protein
VTGTIARFGCTRITIIIGGITAIGGTVRPRAGRVMCTITQVGANGGLRTITIDLIVMVVAGTLSKFAQHPYMALLALIANVGSVATTIPTLAAVVVQGSSVQAPRVIAPQDPVPCSARNGKIEDANAIHRPGPIDTALEVSGVLILGALATTPRLYHVRLRRFRSRPLRKLLARKPERFSLRRWLSGGSAMPRQAVTASGVSSDQGIILRYRSRAIGDLSLRKFVPHHPEWPLKTVDRASVDAVQVNERSSGR